MKSTLLGTKAQDGFDFGFQMDGAELYTGFQFSPRSTSVGGAASSVGGSALTVGGPASDLDNPVEIPRSALTGEAVEALDAQSGPTASFSMVTGGITINLLFDAAAMAAPASFRAGIQQAASILTATISDKITVNINVDYSGTGGGAAAGPSGGQYLSYSTVRADLINNATAGDATFNALPGGSSIQGQSSVAVWNAQLKLWGVLGANNTNTADGSATFATDINPNLLVGVALHELTHAMGRVPYGAPQSSSPDILDLFRFTSPGTRLISGDNTAPAAYFSLDGGNTKLADYGQNSDPSDFLNSGVQGGNDPFNEYYGGGTLQSLTTADKQQLDALGFHTLTPPTTVIEAFGSTSLVEVGSYYYLDSISNGSGPQLKYGGVPVVAGQLGAWTEIGAEVTGSGYEVALKIPGADQYSVWFTDSSGNYVSTAVSSVSGSSAAFESFETSFHQDLNGDGVIGLRAVAPDPGHQTHPNDLTYASTASGANHFIDLQNFEASFPDLIKAFGTNSQAMQTWYNARESTEQRVEKFDGLDYIASYSDLISAFHAGGSMQAVEDAGASHYIAAGLNENRTTTFNGLDYIASYSDLIKAFGANSDAGAFHFIEAGYQEGRKTTFDGLNYIASYSDLIHAFGANEQAGAAHFISQGSPVEGRTTTFDGLAYIAQYTDLMNAYGANNDAGASHYIIAGVNEGRNSAGFNVGAYEQAHPDLIGHFASNDAFLTAYINTYHNTGTFLV